MSRNPRRPGDNRDELSRPTFEGPADDRLLPARLWETALHFCGRREEDARDLFQDVMLRAIRGDLPRAFSRDGAGQLFRVMRNRAIDLGKKRSAERRKLDAFAAAAPPVGETVEESLLAVARRAHAEAIIDGLPPRVRAVVQLRRARKKSDAEIAAALGIAEVSVRVYWKRGLDAITVQMRAWDEGDGK